ncbi:hypothetical protein ACVPOW_13980 [Staphylococcus aureus]
MDLKAKDSHGEYIIDKDAHTRLAKEANTSILRRAFNYVDERTTAQVTSKGFPTFYCFSKSDKTNEQSIYKII